jgi:hypothetical protein
MPLAAIRTERLPSVKTIRNAEPDPRMGAERKAIVLGGNADQVPLIQALGKRGYRTVFIDYYPDPPGRAVADVHHQVSTLDVDAVCRVVEAERPICILDSAEDHHEGFSQYVHQFINSRSSEALRMPPRSTCQLSRTNGRPTY